MHPWRSAGPGSGSHCVNQCKDLAGREPCGVGPLGQVLLFETQPEVAAGLLAQPWLCRHKSVTSRLPPGWTRRANCFSASAGAAKWCRTMFQHHAIGRFGGVLQGIGQFQADVAQSFFLAALARQFQHRRAVVQRRDLAETPGEFRQESAVPGPTSSAVAPGAKASASSKANTLSRYCGSPAIRSCWAWNLSAARAKKSWLTAARWACTASIRARTSSGSARSSTSSSSAACSAPPVRSARAANVGRRSRCPRGASPPARPGPAP